MDLPGMLHCTHPPCCKSADTGRFARSNGSSGPDSGLDFVTLRCHGETQQLPADKILFAEIFDHELHIHTVDGQTFCGRSSLSALKKQLTGRAFLRCHRSYLVNLHYVTSLCRYQITLENGSTIPVSKQNYLAIQQALSAYTR